MSLDFGALKSSPIKDVGPPQSGHLYSRAASKALTSRACPLRCSAVMNRFALDTNCGRLKDLRHTKHANCSGRPARFTVVRANKTKLTGRQARAKPRRWRSG